MKIIEAINGIDSLKHNTYSPSEKIAWLSKVDNMIKKHIIDTHEDSELIIFTGYDENTDLETELLVPAPYDTLYLRWLEAQIDYTNGEYNKYNNAIIMFNTEYEGFANYYNRNHMPKSAGKRFVF